MYAYYNNHVQGHNKANKSWIAKHSRHGSACFPCVDEGLCSLLISPGSPRIEHISSS